MQTAIDEAKRECNGLEGETGRRRELGDALTAWYKYTSKLSYAIIIVRHLVKVRKAM